MRCGGSRSCSKGATDAAELFWMCEGVYGGDENHHIVRIGFRINSVKVSCIIPCSDHWYLTSVCF